MQRPHLTLSALALMTLVACGQSTTPPPSPTLAAQATSPTLQFEAACKDVSKDNFNKLVVSGFAGDKSVTFWTSVRGGLST